MERKIESESRGEIKKMEKNSEEPKLEVNDKGFVVSFPPGSHTRCPLTARRCDGRTCALWLDPLCSELQLVSEMCLFRLAMKKIAGKLTPYVHQSVVEGD